MLYKIKVDTYSTPFEIVNFTLDLSNASSSHLQTNWSQDLFVKNLEVKGLHVQMNLS